MEKKGELKVIAGAEPELAHSSQEARIDAAYVKIREIYRKRGLKHRFYNFYRHWTCPIREIFRHFPQGRHYIDVGCGNGFITIWTALVFPGAAVEGMDLQAQRIVAAKEMAGEIKNLRFMVRDITREEIQDAEIILLIDLFHHIPFASQMPFLKQCTDRTPVGGYIVFKDIDRRPWWKFWVNFMQDFLFTGGRTYSRDREEYIRYFREHGFEAEYFDLMKGYPYSHYLIRARKTR